MRCESHSDCHNDLDQGVMLNRIAIQLILSPVKLCQMISKSCTFTEHIMDFGRFFWKNILAVHPPTHYLEYKR